MNKDLILLLHSLIEEIKTCLGIITNHVFKIYNFTFKPYPSLQLNVILESFPNAFFRPIKDLAGWIISNTITSSPRIEGETFVIPTLHLMTSPPHVIPRIELGGWDLTQPPRRSNSGHPHCQSHALLTEPLGVL